MSSHLNDKQWAEVERCAAGEPWEGARMRNMAHELLRLRDELEDAEQVQQGLVDENSSKNATILALRAELSASSVDRVCVAEHTRWLIEHEDSKAEWAGHSCHQISREWIERLRAENAKLRKGIYGIIGSSDPVDTATAATMRDENKRRGLEILKNARLGAGLRKLVSIDGTRIKLPQVLAQLAEGDSIEAFCGEFGIADSRPFKAALLRLARQMGDDAIEEAAGDSPATGIDDGVPIPCHTRTPSCSHRYLHASLGACLDCGLTRKDVRQMKTRAPNYGVKREEAAGDE